MSPPAPRPPAPRLPALVVILAGDGPLRTALEFSLEVEGFRIDTCPSADSLLATELPTSDACLVIDERLPGMSGVMAVERLRAAGVALPAILLTSHPSAGLHSAAAQLGAYLLEKPLVGDLLPLQIRAAVSSARGLG